MRVHASLCGRMAASGRRRSRRLRGGGKMAGARAANRMKPQDGIHDFVKSSSHIVKPGAIESTLKPNSTESADEEWIYVRGCRIKKAGLRFYSQGDVYVPDSENEEVTANATVSVEMVPAMVGDGVVGVDPALAVAADGAAAMEVTPMVAATGATGVVVAPAMAADGVAAVDMNPEVAGRLAKKVLGEDLHPEVAARLAAVLSEIEPFCHECFIDMYKLLLVINNS